MGLHPRTGWVQQCACTVQPVVASPHANVDSSHTVEASWHTNVDSLYFAVDSLYFVVASLHGFVATPQGGGGGGCSVLTNHNVIFFKLLKILCLAQKGPTRCP